METIRGGWKLALCLLCACGSRSGLGVRYDAAASTTADSSIAKPAPDAPPVFLDVSPVLPDAPVLGDVSPVLPDVPMLSDVSSTLPDAPRLGDVAPGLADAANEVPSSLPDAGLIAFCGGPTSHMAVNGIESYPAVSGRAIPFNCCEGGEFQVITETFNWPITVIWRNTDFVLPATLDLANLPKSWGVQVFVGCDPMNYLCTTPPADSYTSGLTGTLQVSGKIAGYDMSLCLSVAESPDSPHPLVHSLDLYVPQVHAGY
jgi:hypothetical protein